MAYHFHWPLDEILDLEHPLRQRFVEEIGRINQPTELRSKRALAVRPPIDPAERAGRAASRRFRSVRPAARPHDAWRLAAGRPAHRSATRRSSRLPHHSPSGSRPASRRASPSRRSATRSRRWPTPGLLIGVATGWRGSSAAVSGRVDLPVQRRIRRPRRARGARLELVRAAPDGLVPTLAELHGPAASPGGRRDVAARRRPAPGGVRAAPDHRRLGRGRRRHRAGTLGPASDRERVLRRPRPAGSEPSDAPARRHRPGSRPSRRAAGRRPPAPLRRPTLGEARRLGLGAPLRSPARHQDPATPAAEPRLAEQLGSRPARGLGPGSTHDARGSRSTHGRPAAPAREARRRGRRPCAARAARSAASRARADGRPAAQHRAARRRPPPPAPTLDRGVARPGGFAGAARLGAHPGELGGAPNRARGRRSSPARRWPAGRERASASRRRRCRRHEAARRRASRPAALGTSPLGPSPIRAASSGSAPPEPAAPAVGARPRHPAPGQAQPGGRSSPGGRQSQPLDGGARRRRRPPSSRRSDHGAHAPAGALAERRVAARSSAAELGAMRGGSAALVPVRRPFRSSEVEVTRAELPSSVARRLRRRTGSRPRPAQPRRGHRRSRPPTATGSSMSSPGASTAGSGSKLAAELLADRERAGLLVDLR